MIKLDNNIIGNIKKDDWQEVVSRFNYPLLNSFLRTGVLIRNKDLEFDNSLFYQLLLNPKIYVFKKDISKLENKIKTGIIKDANFINNYLSYLEKHCHSYSQLIKSLNKLASKTSEKDKLFKLFLRYKESTLKIISHIYPPLIFEKYIIQNLETLIIKTSRLKKNSEELNNLIQDLIAPDKMSTVMKRELVILKLATSLKLQEINKNNQKIIDEHRQYKWLPDHTWDMSEEGINEFILAIKDAKKSDSNQKIQKIKKEILKTKSKKKHLIDKYKLDKYAVSLVRAASILPVLRGLRLEVILESRHILDENLFRKISKFLTVQDINRYYYWEIEDEFFNKGVDLKLIKSRKLKHSFLASKQGVISLDKEEREKIEKKMDKKIEKLDTIRGAIASLGQTRGIVRIIKDKREYKHFNTGEILVTSMTTPDFVPLMKKSAAIITDEGGISCHAAIVSRELGKPCIIGTKIATSVLKNGQQVEVDANKGVIKIVE